MKNLSLYIAIGSMLAFVPVQSHADDPDTIVSEKTGNTGNLKDRWRSWLKKRKEIHQSRTGTSTTEVQRSKDGDTRTTSSQTHKEDDKGHSVDIDREKTVTKNGDGTATVEGHTDKTFGASWWEAKSVDPSAPK